MLNWVVGIFAAGIMFFGIAVCTIPDATNRWPTWVPTTATIIGVVCFLVSLGLAVHGLISRF